MWSEGSLPCWQLERQQHFPVESPCHSRGCTWGQHVGRGVTYQVCRGHGARTMQGQPLLLTGKEGSNEWPKCPRRDQGRCLGFLK